MARNNYTAMFPNLKMKQSYIRHFEKAVINFERVQREEEIKRITKKGNDQKPA